MLERFYTLIREEEGRAHVDDGRHSSRSSSMRPRREPFPLCPSRLVEMDMAVYEAREDKGLSYVGQVDLGGWRDALVARRDGEDLARLGRVLDRRRSRRLAGKTDVLRCQVLGHVFVGGGLVEKERRWAWRLLRPVGGGVGRVLCYCVVHMYGKRSRKHTWQI